LLKLYTIYSPPNHPPGAVHKTKAEAEGAEAEYHGTQSRRPAKSGANAGTQRRAVAQSGLRRRSEGL
jgi:hypothetical protein